MRRIRSNRRRLREEVVQRHLGLDAVPIGIVHKPAGRHQCQMKCFSGFGNASERLQLLGERRGGFGIDGILVLRVFHFADVDHVVGAVKQEIDLGSDRINLVPGMPPGVGLGVDAANPECIAHLVQMLKAKALESESAPCGLLLRGDCRCPEVAVGSLSVQKLEVEQGEVVDQLIKAVPALVAERPVSADEAAFLQRLQGIGELPGLLKSGCGGDVSSGRAGFPFGERADDLDVVGRVFEKGRIEFDEFPLERCVGGKEKPVKVLCEAETFCERSPVIGNASDGHVAFGNVLARQGEPSLGGISLALAQRERVEEDSGRDAVVEPSPVPKDALDNPGRRGAADDEEYVLSGGSPFVPKGSESRQELRAGRVHPRQFVNENDFAGFLAGCDDGSKEVKSLEPVLWAFPACASVCLKGFEEMGELALQVGVQQTGMLKGESVAEGFAHEISLADSAASVDGDEFGLVGVEQAVQFLYFCGSSNHGCAPLCLETCDMIPFIGDKVNAHGKFAMKPNFISLKNRDIADYTGQMCWRTTTKAGDAWRRRTRKTRTAVRALRNMEMCNE